MKKLFMKSLLVVAGLLVGASAWAAGYTRTLSDKLEIAGYSVKAFYDFQNNSPEVLPTSGDLRYRAYENGGYWGLHNFGSGGRSASATIPVEKSDILVLQIYSPNTVPTINCGSLNNTLTTANSPYYVYDITTTSENINFSVPRNGGIVAALVMEKDASAETADYTINYICGEDTVKTVSETDIAVGSIINTESSFFVDGVKYIRKEGEAENLTIASGNNELDVNVRVANTCGYTVNAVAGDNVVKELASGTIAEGESVTVACPQYILSEEKLYVTANNGNAGWYMHTFAPTQDGQVFTVNYTESVQNVVFYTEAEDIEGTSHGDNAARASKGKMGYTANNETYINVTTLAPGKYKIYMRGVNGNSASRTVNYKVGNRKVFTFSITNGTNQLGNSEEFVVAAENAVLSFACDGSSASGTDWFYVQFVGEPTEEELAAAEAADIKADKAARVFNIIGLGNDWNTDHQMTQSSVEGEEDIYTFTTTMIVRGNEADSYFEYKLRQNSNFDGYQLPALGQGNKSWKDQVNGIGIYTITFTADVANHTLDSEATKTDFEYAVVGCTYDGSEEVQSELFAASAWNTATTDVMTKQADGTFVWKKDEVELPAKWIDLKVIARNGEDVIAWFGNGEANVGLNINETGAGTYYVTVTFDGSNVTATAEQKHVWTVAGNNTTLFGTAWAADATNNDMTRNDEGIWTITYENKTLTAGTIEYKIVQDHDWSLPNYGYNGNNATAEIPADGEYNVTFTFNASTKATSCEVVPTTVTKSISDAGYATYCSPYALDFSKVAGLKAYIAVADGAAVSFTQVQDVPANTGVLLKGEAGEYNIAVAASSETNVTNNAFVGVLENTQVAAGAFVLMNGDLGVGFYKTTQAFTVGANTAYLRALPGGARFFGFDSNVSTSINTVAAEQHNGEVYNLQGQRVVAPAKGLYIVNGKKVVLK